jgi:hypothetical protein
MKLGRAPATFNIFRAISLFLITHPWFVQSPFRRACESPVRIACQAGMIGSNGRCRHTRERALRPFGMHTFTATYQLSFFCCEQFRGHRVREAHGLRIEFGARCDKFSMSEVDPGRSRLAGRVLPPHQGSGST